jgi:hypothetical protein
VLRCGEKLFDLMRFLPKTSRECPEMPLLKGMGIKKKTLACKKLSDRPERPDAREDAARMENLIPYRPAQEKTTAASPARVA